MLDFWTHLECDALYKLSIEHLDLSAETYLLVTRAGLRTIIDCIQYFQNVDYGACISAPIGFFTSMEEEVKPKLWEKGYGKWLNPQALDLLNRFHRESQYENPIEYSGFTIRTANLLREAGLRTLSDCADFLIHFNAGQLENAISPELQEALLGEVQERLKLVMNWS
jgi:hypothetical protein